MRDCQLICSCTGAAQIVNISPLYWHAGLLAANKYALRQFGRVRPAFLPGGCDNCYDDHAIAAYKSLTQLVYASIQPAEGSRSVHIAA